MATEILLGKYQADKCTKREELVFSTTLSELRNSLDSEVDLG
jgi:hypothetical protein